MSTARNRFNLRTTSTTVPSTEEKHTDENVIDDTAAPTSSTQRALRARPGFNVRGRSRTTAVSSTTAPASGSDVAEVAEQTEPKTEVSSEKPSAPAKPSPRFSSRRPNQLIGGRGRLSPLTKTAAPSAESPNDGNADVVADSEKSASDQIKGATQEAVVDDNESSQNETSIPVQTGINRLRSRPRLQVHAAAPHKAPSTGPAVYNNANRKVNPLLSRRKLGSSTTTTTGTCHETIGQHNINDF